MQPTSPQRLEDADVAAERQRVRQGQYSAVRVAVLARDLTKRFGRTVALDRLCLSIERGECFGLLGPNGAGKSTLIALLTGLFPPSSGFAAVGNYDIWYVAACTNTRANAHIRTHTHTHDRKIHATSAWMRQYMRM